MCYGKTPFADIHSMFPKVQAIIDPSYEIKDDFIKINNILDNLEEYKNSKILIWYPILSYEDNDKFIEDLRKKTVAKSLS